jgi:hypothetical protein
VTARSHDDRQGDGPPAQWIPSKLTLTSGMIIELGVQGVTIHDRRAAIPLTPRSSTEASELSIALKRAQKRMDQIFREMRAAEDGRRR